jgi:hypothetical protein
VCQLVLIKGAISCFSDLCEATIRLVSRWCIGIFFVTLFFVALQYSVTVIEHKARIVGGGMGDYLRMISRVSVYLALHYICNIL